MAIPPIEIRWGGGKWNGGHKRAVRPYVEAATDLAVDGFSGMGISYAEPKVANIWRASRFFGEVGSAADARNFDLYIEVDDIKRRRVARIVPELVVASFHELFHTVRSEHFPHHETLIETCATEGLAHFATHRFARALLSPNEGRSAWLSMRGDDVGQLDILRQEFAHDVMDETSGTEAPYEVYERWFDGSDGDSLPSGVTIGVMAVHDLLQSGHEIADLMAVAPEDIIGLDI